MIGLAEGFANLIFRGIYYEITLLGEHKVGDRDEVRVGKVQPSRSKRYVFFIPFEMNSV